MHRKTSVGKADHQARAMTLAKAFRVSLAKVADELCDMAMAVIGVRHQLCKAAALSDMLDAQSLLVLLDGTLQRRGAAVFDASFVGGLIQQQTMGKVMPAPPEETRQLTATDAAICAPFLDDLLSRAATLPEEEAQRLLIEGFRFGAFSEEPRQLMMALDRPEYEVFHLTVDMAGGVRQGQIMLCFPVPETDMSMGGGNSAAHAAGSAGAPPKASHMENTVMALSVELNVAVARIHMPLSDLQALEPGQVLDLKVNSFEHSIVQTQQGRRLSRGKLGQIGGVRALQLEHAPPSIIAPRRRASDRADLDLPNVSGDGTGMQPAGAADNRQIPARLPSVLPGIAAENAVADLPEPAEAPLQGGVPDLADMQSAPDLPDLPDMQNAPDLPDLPGLPDLPDLPEMSDLPNFDEEEGAPEMTIT